MKPIYPFSEMQVGEVREVSTHRSRKAVYSAGWEYAKKHPSEDGSRPKFKVECIAWFVDEVENVCRGIYRIERTA
jgi:hypothetical protein